MPDARIVEWIRGKFQALGPELDESARRRWAAIEAWSLGRGGASAVSAATGLSRNTIRSGIRQVQSAAVETGPRRIRRPGGGRKRLTDRAPDLQRALEALVESATRGDPCWPLRGTCKSTRQLAAELSRPDGPLSHMTVARLLREAGYSLQANRKTREGASHPDRNAQFEYINDQALAFQERGRPLISVDRKKKEWVGNFPNGGREWRPKGKPLAVKAHDFQEAELGQVIPYGVYGLTNNEAWVSVGIDHDTAELAAAAIQRWWRKMGRRRSPKARELYITADGGGSQGSRSRLWKVALQKLANRTGLTLSISHFPAGTSKWNKIQHRLFCHITQNRRGRPLVSQEIIIKLIGSTTTESGLQVRAGLDRRKHPTRKKVSNEQLAQVRLIAASFHGDWNYSVAPD